MSPLAHLLLAACVLHAAAPAALDKNIDQTDRVKPADIPVEVLVEHSQPSIKANEINNEEEIKRPSIDLRNPGPPQRQEHETQNPEPISELQQQVAAVRDSILQTHALLRQGVQGVSDDIQNWLVNNRQINVIQQNIQSLRQTFADQIQKLNSTVQSLALPLPSKPEETPTETQIKTDFEQVKSHLSILEKNFNNGVRALSDGVNVVAYIRAESGTAQVRADGDSAAATTQPTTPNPINFIQQLVTVLQDRFSSGISNITQAFNNAVGVQNTPPNTGSALADTPEGTTTTQRYPWPQLPSLPSFPNLFGQSQSQGQGSQTTAQPGPIAQVIQGYQEFLQNLLPGRPGATTSKPSEAASGSNVVPEKITVKQPEAPAAVVADPAPVPAPIVAPVAAVANPPEPVGPIRQILNNNPVVQGIAGAVQRIQSSINNPEKPREPEKNNDVQTKGGFYGKPPYPHGGGSGDNSNSGLKQQNDDIVKEDIIVAKDTKKEPEDIKETSPEKKTE